jgi:hypothetical protein
VPVARRLAIIVLVFVAIVDEMIMLFRRFDLASTHGVGTTFTARLPIGRGATDAGTSLAS